MKYVIFLTIMVITIRCAPFDKIYSHDFDSGYFRLKTSENKNDIVYANVKGDSVSVFSVSGKGKNMLPDTDNKKTFCIGSVNPGDPVYNSSFVKTSADIDLSTVLLKYRPAAGDVPQQLNANVNGILYAGFRKDFFKIKSLPSILNMSGSFIRHTGIDFGIFAGFGITQINPTVTMGRTLQEYDGIVFLKGISGFVTYENMSVGLALGFDNLLDHNKNIWVYNNKPWLGLVIGIANF